MYRIGIASSDGLVVNQHFGKANRFLIVETDDSGGFTAVEERRLAPVCDGGSHDPDRLDKNAALLTDCDYLLVSRIGQGALNVLENKGISVYEIPDLIENAVGKLLNYIEIQKLLN